jgi:hypothetical protein
MFASQNVLFSFCSLDLIAGELHLLYFNAFLYGEPLSEVFFKTVIFLNFFGCED